jgi:hypothetical protein
MKKIKSAKLRVSIESVNQEAAQLLYSHRTAIVAMYRAGGKTMPSPRLVYFCSQDQLRGVEPNFVVIPVTACKRALFDFLLSALGRCKGPCELVLCVS